MDDVVRDTIADVMNEKVHYSCVDRVIIHHHHVTTTNSYFSTSTLPYKQKAPQALTKSPNWTFLLCLLLLQLQQPQKGVR